jgi:hypothetical protein
LFSLNLEEKDGTTKAQCCYLASVAAHTPFYPVNRDELMEFGEA